LNRQLNIVDSENVPAQNASILSAGIIPSEKFVQSLVRDGKLMDDPDWATVKILQFPWHIFLWNDWAIREDFVLLTKNRKSAPIPAHVQTLNPSGVFIEEGAKLSYCILNAETGPIYIGKNAEIMEGTTIRGPFALCEGSVVKMGAQIYGATTIGPYSTVGGEIKNSVVFGFSNKSHYGYLGDSVVGEWCNLGAGTSNSNVKNNASEIRMYNHGQQEMIGTGLIKCGLIMGDYSRSSINTSFNTGTLVGICANVFGGGLSPKYIPSFSWGIDGTTRYDFEKAVHDMDKWKKLKGHRLTDPEKRRLKLIFDEN
jgi:UDP-N-acetylglucosamine diphosphorylase/glucosamine-1-phosphate N-acetyltransferase